MSKIEQDFDSAVAGGGNDREVGFTSTYAGGGRNTIRRSTMVMPSGTTLTYDYGTGNDSNASRVRSVKIGSTAIATYD